MFILFLVLVMNNISTNPKPILLDFQGMNHRILFPVMTLYCHHVNQDIGDIVILMTLSWWQCLNVGDIFDILWNIGYKHFCRKDLSPASIRWNVSLLNISSSWFYLGNVQRDLKLNFEKDTQVYYSCGASLNGQYWIIGGSNEKRQVSHF